MSEECLSSFLASDSVPGLHVVSFLIRHVSLSVSEEIRITTKRQKQEQLVYGINCVDIKPLNILIRMGFFNTNSINTGGVGIT
jgi:hypothetical protein